MLGETAASACDVARLETLEREILAISDHERRILGQELHDGLCQSLIGIAALTAVLSRSLAANAAPGPAAAAAEIVRLLNQTIGEARGLAHGLCPVGLNGAGLVDALDSLARNVSRGQGAFCTFVEDGDCPGLCQEATAHLVVATPVVGEHLDGDLPVEHVVVGQPHGGERPGTEHAQESVRSDFPCVSHRPAI